MERKYILAVKPLEPYILQIDFISGSRLLLDMKPYVDKIRFRTLTDLIHVMEEYVFGMNDKQVYKMTTDPTF